MTLKRRDVVKVLLKL
jgi:hypothetical protein